MTTKLEVRFVYFSLKNSESGSLQIKLFEISTKKAPLLRVTESVCLYPKIIINFIRSMQRKKHTWFTHKTP